MTLEKRESNSSFKKLALNYHENAFFSCWHCEREYLGSDQKLDPYR
jgi:hypothetical protein